MKTILTIFSLVAMSTSCLALDITTMDGKTYANAKITKEEADGLTIMHSGGIIKLPFSSLPAEIQQQYGYDPVKAQAYQKARADQRNTAIRKNQVLKQIEEREFDGEIGQMLEGSAIVYPVDYRSSYSVPSGVSMSPSEMNSAIQRSILAPKYKEYGDPVLIVGISSALVDGESWKGKIYPCGQYRYTTVEGAPKTIRKYATSRELALQIITQGK